MAESRNAASSSVARWVIGAILGAGFIWAFPLFHVARLAPPTSASAPAAGAFDAAATAARIWHTDLPAAAARAPDLATVVTALRRDASAAKAKYAKSAGLGASYFFVRGRGKILAHDRNYLRIALAGASPEVVALRIGPIFGNTVRDGCGILDVNAFPGLQEFNALSAELNGLVEQSVLPRLKTEGTVGRTIAFAGCAEAPESVADPDEPVLTIVPVEANLP